MKKKPLVIAHRGSSAHAPENTMPAFERACREGADGIEFDLWKCFSGELVITHDQETSRVTGQAGDVEKLSLTQLGQRDFGAHKGPQFQGEKIPLLADVLDLAKDMELINIEVKGKSFRSNGIEKDLLSFFQDHPLRNQIIVSSFNPLVLYRLGRQKPPFRLGLIFYEGASLPLRRAWARFFLNLVSLHPSFPLLTPALRASTIKKNQKLIAWTINNIQQLEACIHHGVDGMITDDPAWMIQSLEKPESGDQ